MKTDITKINEYISYIPPSNDPLSANIGIIEGKRYTYIYDVGAANEVADTINSLKGEKIVFLSHFHADHVDNLSKVVYYDLYQGEKTYKYTRLGKYLTEADKTVIDDSVALQGNVEFTDEALDGTVLKISAMIIPSSHAKGCLGLMVNDEYLFVGDATYCTSVKGVVCYNAQKLKEEIDLLKSLPCKYVLVSHEKKFVRPIGAVVRMLESIYEKRAKNDPYIKVDL